MSKIPMTRKVFVKLSEPECAARYARTRIAIERNIIARARIPIMQRLVDGRRIESLAHQDLLFLLEGLGGIERGGDPQEQRVCVCRQPAREMIPELSEIEAIIDHDRGHAGATVMAGDLDAIGRRIEHAFACADRFIALAGRDVLALPAEGVDDT